MRLSKKRLRRIIEEEISCLLEANPKHDSKGRFSNQATAKTYSLTANAEDDVSSDDLEVPARGKITSTGKVGAKYGMNTGSPDKQCGRLTIDGTEKKKTRSCKDYPKKYWDEEGVLGEDEVMSPADDAYIKGLVVQQVKSALQAIQKSGGHQGRGCSWDEIMRAVNDVETATKARKQEK